MNHVVWNCSFPSASENTRVLLWTTGLLVLERFKMGGLTWTGPGRGTWNTVALLSPIVAVGVLVVTLFVYSQYLRKEIFELSAKLLRLSETIQRKVGEAHLVIGAHGMAALCSELEVSAWRDDLDQAPELLRKLQARFERAREMVQSKIESGLGQ